MNTATFFFTFVESQYGETGGRPKIYYLWSTYTKQNRIHGF